jgi:hypothetical protein
MILNPLPKMSTSFRVAKIKFGSPLTVTVLLDEQTKKGGNRNNPTTQKASLVNYQSITTVVEAITATIIVIIKIDFSVKLFPKTEEEDILALALSVSQPSAAIVAQLSTLLSS